MSLWLEVAEPNLNMKGEKTCKAPNAEEKRMSTVSQWRASWKKIS